MNQEMGKFLQNQKVEREEDPKVKDLEDLYEGAGEEHCPLTVFRD
jgi:hypothetical protein